MTMDGWTQREANDSVTSSIRALQAAAGNVPVVLPVSNNEDGGWTGCLGPTARPPNGYGDGSTLVLAG